MNTNMTVLSLTAIFAVLAGHSKGKESAESMHKSLAAHEGLFTPEVLLRYCADAGIEVEPEFEEGEEEEVKEQVKAIQKDLPGQTNQPSPDANTTTVAGEGDPTKTATETEKVADKPVDGAGNTKPGANSDVEEAKKKEKENVTVDKDGKAPDGRTKVTGKAKDDAVKAKPDKGGIRPRTA